MARSDRGSADLELVRRALAGEERSIRAFLDKMRCVPRILHVKNAQLGSPLQPEELADLVQETLLAVWGKLGRYDGQAILETWVYRFCQFELLRRLRSLRRAPRQLADAEARPIEGALEALQEESELERVLSGLEDLPPELAQVLRLKHLEELTFDELGTRLEISPNTAKTRYYRGLEKLREWLGRTTGSRAALSREEPSGAASSRTQPGAANAERVDA